MLPGAGSTFCDFHACLGSSSIDDLLPFRKMEGFDAGVLTIKSLVRKKPLNKNL